MPPVLRDAENSTSRGARDPREASRLSVQWCQPQSPGLCLEPSLPSGGIHRRSDGKPAHIPGNGPSGAWRIHRHRLHKFPHMSGKSCWPFRCRAPCKPPPAGRSGRNPYRARCSGPSSWDCLPAGRRLRNDHTLRHSRYRPRYTIETVHAPWSSPKKGGLSYMHCEYAASVWERGKIKSSNYQERACSPALFLSPRVVLDLNGLSSSEA